VSTTDEFLESLQKYLRKNVSPESELVANLHDIQFIVSFIKYQCEKAEGIFNEKKLSKEDKGVAILLKNPYWSDERIRELLKTTEKQMRHWTNFNQIRRVFERNGILAK
jgi:hypothetical protein